MPDFTEYTDEELDSLRLATLIEQERRESLAQIPMQITELAAKFRSGGGDEQTLTAAFNA